MDCTKTGQMIRKLRLEKNLTQFQLAKMLNISDKAISKWERGTGFPDVSLLQDLSEILGINLKQLLSGEFETNNESGGNMKKINFYVCPKCGNIITSSSIADISCCSMKLEPLTAVKATSDDDKLNVEKIENEFFISSNHEMTKEHYISFVALVTGESLTLRRQYPEWDMQTRFVCSHGMLVWYCTKHGLMYQLI
jgi:DNA-binding XRE family transcriptional regulator/desulfoferrodoxin (superoxide reductase-like protein)